MAKRLSEEEAAKARALFAGGASLRAIARELSRGFTSVRTATKDTPSPKSEASFHPVVRKSGLEDGEVEFTSDKPVVTEADAIAYGQIDTAIWYVDRMEVNAWQVAMKASRGHGRPDAPVKKQLWRVKLYLKRIQPKPFQAAHEALFERIKAHAPRYPILAPPVIRQGSHLLEVDLYDVHFGKLAWAVETGQNYDLSIAERVYRNAVEDLVARSHGYRIDQIVLPIGSDFFHVDGPAGATSSGTRVDSDSRYAKIIEAGEMAVVRAVEYLAAIAPVKVIQIPGNHDRVSSFHLGRFIHAWFHNSNRVEVDYAPRPRKYLRFGKNLIGYTHGDGPKGISLVTIMATEMPSDWSETICREWRIGHVHKSKQIDTVSVDTHNGVSIRTLRSLSAVDAWHFEQGFVGGTRAADGFLLSVDDGCVANYSANARE